MKQTAGWVLQGVGYLLALVFVAGLMVYGVQPGTSVGDAVMAGGVAAAAVAAIWWGQKLADQGRAASRSRRSK